MSQTFRQSANIAIVLGRSTYVLHELIEQPLQFSHMHHVTDNGIDCRYRQTSVETSSFAGIPPTKTCMNFHSVLFANASFLEPVRELPRQSASCRCRSA